MAARFFLPPLSLTAKAAAAWPRGVLAGPLVHPLPADVGVRAAPGSLGLVLAPSSLLGEVEARLLLDAAARGRDAVVVCSDNRLDAYGLLARARARGLEDALADGVHLARAFTLHQFVALVEETLPRLARGRRAGLALVTGVLEPFLDEDVRPAEARVLLPRVLRGLDAIAAATGVPVVATGDPTAGGGAWRLGVSEAPGRRAALAALARAHARALDSTPPPPRRAQRTLDAFAEAG